MSAGADNKGIRHSLTLWSSIACSLLLMGIAVLRWSPFEAGTPFIGFLLVIAAFPLTLGVLVWTLVAGVVGLRRNRPSALLPLAIVVSTLLVVSFSPLQQWLLDYDFRTGLPAREEVVTAIESGRLQEAGLVLADSDLKMGIELVQLPDRYAHLSRGGLPVVVLRDGNSCAVLFYTYLSFEGTFEGLVYSSSDHVPVDKTPFRNVKNIRRLQDHWYWVFSWYDHGRPSTPTIS